jgi:uncharacterized membrane protein YjgN (DUF898 family)
MPKGNCEFEATGGQYFSTVILHLVIFSVFSLGLYLPWALVRLFKLKASHTTIQGKKTTFTGGGGQLFLLLFLNGLLTIVTLGLYGPWAFCRIYGWKADHTLVDGTPSRFSGTGGGLFVLYLIHLFLLPMITFGFYYLVGMYRFHAWKEEHTQYGGKATSFGAGLGQYIKICLLTWILNSITFGLFSPWALCMLYKWQMGGLVVGDKELVDHFPPVGTSWRAVVITFLMGLLLVGAAGFFVMEQIQFLMQLHSQGPLKETGVLKSRIMKKKTDIPAPSKVPKTAENAKKPPPLSPVGQKGATGKPVDGEKAPSKKPEKKPEKGSNDVLKDLHDLNLFIKDNPENAMALYNRACLYASKGDSNQAIGDYTESLKIDPDNGDAYYNRGILRAKMKQYEKAVEDFQKAVALRPDFGDAYCNQGNANYALGKYILAIRDYTKALNLNPKDGVVYFNRGLAYLALEKKDRALADFNKALELGQKQAERFLKQAKGS